MHDMNQWEWDNEEPAVPRPIVPPHPIGALFLALKKAKAATWWRYCLSDRAKRECPCCLGAGKITVLYDPRRAA